MSIVLFRIDERLIHGQVVVGWGGRLRPDLFVVVDSALASSEWEQELFLSAEEGRDALPGLREAPERAFVLTRDIATMLALASGGSMSGDAVNVGGIHSQTGRDEVLPYLFLDDEDRGRLRDLAEEGVTVSARDLPGSHEVTLKVLLG